MIELQQYNEWVKLPLQSKILMSYERIIAWYEAYDGMVSVSFSGGLDSNVLRHLVHSLYPDVPLVFCNTGIEYPEIVKFARSCKNIVEIRPRLGFKQVVERYGYPLISKRTAKMIHACQNPSDKNAITRRRYIEGITRNGDVITNPSQKLSKKWRYLINSRVNISDKCCRHLKEDPLRQYSKSTGRMPFIGTMATESDKRKMGYLDKGCNLYDSRNPRSVPVAFWTKEDIWKYIKTFNLHYSPIYDMGYERTGCMFCMFGMHLHPNPNRFQLMRLTHPLHYKAAMKMGLGRLLDLINVRY